MKYRFKAIPDYEKIIEEKLSKLCKKFRKFPSIIVKIDTEITTSGMMWFDIDILTPEVKFKGYSHVATLKIEEIENEGKIKTVNIVFPSNKYQKENFSKYYDIDFRCDHCHTNRHRLTVHLFRHDKSNKDLMIASSCAKAYFGERVYKLLGLYELLNPQMIEADLDDIFGEYGGRDCSRFNTMEYCKMAYSIMKKTNTYVSKSKKENMDTYGYYIESTQDRVDFLFNSTKGLPEDIKREVLKQRKECGEIAKDFDIIPIKDFWYEKYQEREESYEYEGFNRFCFLNLSLISPKRGMLVYAVYLYMREIEGAFNSNIGDTNSKHIGKEGDRLRDIKATVSFVSVRETDYGLSTIIKFLDEKGNILVWFASKRIDLMMNQTVFLTGTVKKHDEFKGKKQTLLARCRIIQKQI